MNHEDLKTWRLSTGRSQPEMAKHIGVSSSTYQNWEQGIRKPGAAGTRLLELVKRAEVFCPQILEGLNNE